MVSVQDRTIPDPDLPRRSISILGATGSIGRSTRAIIRENRHLFRVEAVVAGSDAAALALVAIEMSARFAVIADSSKFQELKEALEGTGIEVGAGKAAVIEAATRPVDRVVAAITGIAGLEPTYAAALAGQTIALANKETLVSAGEMFMRSCATGGATILPLDSEHNALFQALGSNPVSSVERMILTASGGPFLTWSREQISAATRQQALAHPNWSMGPKVTIDSATLMNKGLELIEAHHIFQISPEKLAVLVHPQSIVHGLISFTDGSVTAGMAMPDMRVPVAHCLGWPHRLLADVPRLDLAAISSLSFAEADRSRFPALALAEQALRAGGAMPTVLNGANEIAVAAFLNDEISLSGIAALVEETMDRVTVSLGNNTPPQTLDEVNAVNLVARRVAQEGLSSGRTRAIR